MRFVLGCGLVLAAVAAGNGARADDKIDAKKLLGKWELKHDAKGDKAGLKATVEFAAGGKVSMTVEQGGKATKVDGTYTLDGDRLTVNLPVGGKDDKQVLTVKKLTDAELVTEDEKKQTDTFVRVKEKEKPKEK